MHIGLCVMKCSQPHRGHQFASRRDTSRLRMAIIRGKLQAIHWTAVARSLPTSKTAIETVSVVLFCKRNGRGANFCSRKIRKPRLQLINLIQKQSKIEHFQILFKECLLPSIKKCPSCFKKWTGDKLFIIEFMTYYNVS